MIVRADGRFVMEAPEVSPVPVGTARTIHCAFFFSLFLMDFLNIYILQH